MGVITDPHRSAVLAGALVLAACASSLGRRGGMEHTIGRGSYHDIMTEVPEIFRRNGYAIFASRETTSTLYIETAWQDRAPFEDEAEAGATYARTRFVAQARLAGPAVYTLRVTAYNQVRFDDDPWPESRERPDLGGGWTVMPPSGMYATYVTELTTEIRLKVDAGMRTFGAPIRYHPPSHTLPIPSS
ncbi:MAG: hypothetical protein OEZ65_14170 [Gemmatimonadota bacterium]|nr:hypothetical protein [Gemmatimonadota bacterium]